MTRTTDTTDKSLTPRMNRRGVIRLAGIGAATAGLAGVAACSSGDDPGTAPSSGPANLPRPDTGLPAGDTSRGADNFFISDRLDARGVTFRNQFGQRISANLFTPKNMCRGTRNAAVIVSHPMGAVKEQSANLYAQKLAEQGFVTLSVDHAYWGSSEGDPRNLVAPDDYAESYNAATDYLRTLDHVDRERIGALGICGSGSFVISAAKIDPGSKPLPP